MALKLGKNFDRNYNIRLPFLDGYYDIGAYFNKKSTFLLFSVDPDFHDISVAKGVKINMFKNLESSKFAETFLDLHNYRKSTLDIINQFQAIKNEYFHDVNYIFNETLRLSRIEVENRVLYDSLTLYGLTMSAYNNESIFIIAERQNIIKKLGKKLVRTTGLQIMTSRALNLVNEFYDEATESKRLHQNLKRPIVNSDDKDIISLNDIEE